MTKVQKVWLSVFLAMFILPELLWSPVGNFWYESSQKTNHVVPLRNNFLVETGNINIWSNIMLFQFFGLIGLCIYLIFIRKNFTKKLLFWIIWTGLLLLALWVFILYSLSTIKINF